MLLLNAHVLACLLVQLLSLVAHCVPVVTTDQLTPHSVADSTPQPPNSKPNVDLDNEQVSAAGDPLGPARTVLKGSYEGILEIDPTSGWLLRKNATMKCSGQVKMYATEKIPQGRTLYVTMETATTVEPIE